MLILGIETSCDDSSIAVYSAAGGLLSLKSKSQDLTHAEWGGVVPELASRDHAEVLLSLYELALADAGVSQSQIDYIAYTAGPGLVGALLVGATFAHGLALSLGKPALAVHHLQAHLIAAFLEKHKPTYPLINLLVSGGHTQLIYSPRCGVFELLGETLDDAAGEAFDKIAKFMGLGFPGGPALANVAKQGDPNSYKFTIPKRDRTYDFSFSGLKTQALRCWQATPDIEEDKVNFAASIEKTIVDSLLYKVKLALDNYPGCSLVAGGGVSANDKLRESLVALGVKRGIEVFLPSKVFCSDNAAMVCICAYKMLAEGDANNDSAIFADAPWVKARWPLASYLWR
jgi:N6-L-threonylcarbamoyladenine synthase